MGRRTPAVSRPGQGRVPESGQGECHAASFFPRLLPPASGAEMQIVDAEDGRGGAGAGAGGARSLIPFTEADTFTAVLQPAARTYISHLRGAGGGELTCFPATNTSGGNPMLLLKL